MKKILLIFLFSFTCANSQTSKNIDFEKFAKVSDSLMNKAYETSDVNKYLKLLNEFSKKFENLSEIDKKYFKGYNLNTFYNLSCIYSLKNDKKNALIYLEKAIDAGESNFKHIQVDKDLDNIRNEEKYKLLIKKLRDEFDYLYILKKAGNYNVNENRELPSFTYQSENNENLISLRQKYKLDSVAGKGNEVSKIINLMHFIHYLVPHNGSAGIPNDRNAMNIISKCRDKKGVNCRGMAMVLNECYLSMGIKSRYVSCKPKDSLGIDTDSHVINMVYSNQLKKWLWIDPSFDAYVMNENGELLSIEEVRFRLINDKPLLLNPDANHNRVESQTKEYYLRTYMAKNLYQLECPLSSEYDYETSNNQKEIKFLRLIPLAYFNKSLNEEIIEEGTFKKIKYKTNNAQFFWQKP